MPYFLNLEARNTWKWIDAYSDKDSWTPVARVKVVHSKTIYPESEEDRIRWVKHIRLPVGVNSKDAQRAVANTMSLSKCTHEYDCCGCAIYYTKTRMLSKRDMLVVVDVLRNY